MDYLVPEALLLALSVSGAVDRERFALAPKCPKFSNQDPGRSNPCLDSGRLKRGFPGSYPQGKWSLRGSKISAEAHCKAV